MVAGKSNNGVNKERIVERVLQVVKAVSMKNSEYVNEFKTMDTRKVEDAIQSIIEEEFNVE